MALPSDYISGTITLTNGSTAFTGTGTGWLAADFREGDIILDVEGGEGAVAVIASITSNTAGVLSKEWEGPTLTGVAYRMRYQWDSGRVSAQSRAAVEMLGNGNLQSFAALTGPGVPVFDGPHSVTIKPESDFVNGVAYDVQVDTLADRDAYDGQSEGFAVLVSDVGDGRSALYSKNSNAVGDWSDPAYITGPVGPLPDVEATVTSLPPGSTATVTEVPITGGVRLDFELPEASGFYNAGVYNIANPYNQDDVVQFNGSSFIALQSVPVGESPSSAFPPVDTAYWQVLAAKGQDGNITGVTPFWQSRILNDADAAAAQTGLGVPTMGFVGGVLTLASGIAVPESDVIGATTIYLTPALTNFTALWSGTAWRAYEFAEISLALPTSLVAGDNYDVWEFDNGSGTLTIGIGPSWFSGAINGGNNARGQGAGSSELEVFQGRLVNKNTIQLTNGGLTRTVPARQARLRGTIRMTANGVTEDSKLKRFVSNVHNAPLRHLVKTDTTDTWDYSLAVWRQARAAADNQVEYVQTVAGRLVEAQVLGITYNITGSVNAIQGSVGIGIDSTSVESSQRRSGAVTFNRFTSCEAYYKGYPGIGYHRLVWLELGGAHATDVNRWVGDMGAIGPNAFQTGISAEMVV